MNKYRIAIVENDEDEQEFMQEAFDDSPFFEIAAQLKSANELFDWLAETNLLPDVILTDFNMPGKNGHDILNMLSGSSKFRNILVIVTSTSSTPSIVEKCLKEGAAAYMVKPETFGKYPVFVQELYEKLEALSHQES